jgi:hypothetical protein
MFKGYTIQFLHRSRWENNQVAQLEINEQSHVGNIKPSISYNKAVSQLALGHPIDSR